MNGISVKFAVTSSVTKECVKFKKIKNNIDITL
jgi:hypothetical protein